MDEPAVTTSLGAEVVDLAGLGDALTETDEIDLIFECSGVEPLANAAIERVRVGGTVVIIALYDDPLTLDVNALVQKEIRVQGCIADTSEDFAEGLGLLEGGKVLSPNARRIDSSSVKASSTGGGSWGRVHGLRRAQQRSLDVVDADAHPLRDQGPAVGRRGAPCSELSSQDTSSLPGSGRLK